jgi:hypothetical protein
MIEHRATKPLERHTLLVQHDEDQRPRFLAQEVAVGGRARKVLVTKLCTKLCFVTIITLCKNKREALQQTYVSTCRDIVVPRFT